MEKNNFIERICKISLSAEVFKSPDNYVIYMIFICTASRNKKKTFFFQTNDGRRSQTYYSRRLHESRLLPGDTMGPAVSFSWVFNSRSSRASSEEKAKLKQINLSDDTYFVF